MKCKKDRGMWWLLVRLFYRATYYWEWLGFVIWRLYCRATSVVRPACSAALYTSTTSVMVYPPLNLTEDLTDKMLVHVNKNNIVWFVFEHSFQLYSYNFRWHASSFIVLYIMLVQFFVILIYSSKVPMCCTEEWNALIGELFILTKDVGVISCVTGIDRFLRILFHL